jgi:microcystin-dependent protein
MAQPYIGEIRMFAGTYQIEGWAFCDGRELPIAENEALFQLIGTQYGGDGQSTFALPNLSGRIPIGSDNASGSWGTNWVFGQMAGTESVTLTVTQSPVHTHALLGSNAVGTASAPANNVPASIPGGQLLLAYGTDEPYTALSPTSLAPVGGSQPHDNQQPYLGINFIISLFGIYPSPT